jgi:CRISPR type III-B/RAMP module-associated protein Cmr5
MQTGFVERARHARERVTALKRGDTVSDKYLTAVRGLPAEIRLVGLGQALATLLSRGKSDGGAGFKLLYDHVEDWMLLKNPHQVYPSPTAAAPRLLHTIIAGDNTNYQLAVAEVDAYLAVLKRLAEIFLTPDKRAADPAQSPEPAR